jgi:hypothetical protein
MNDLWSAQHAPNDDDGIWIRPLPREEPPRPSTPEDGVWVRPPVNPVPNYYYYNAGDDIVIVKIVPDIVEVANDAAADDTKVTTEVAADMSIARPPVPDGYYYNPGDDEYDEIKMEIDRATANVDRLEIKAAADKDCVADADETIYKDCATDSEHTDETIYKDCVTDSEHADEESGSEHTDEESDWKCDCSGDCTDSCHCDDSNRACSWGCEGECTCCYTDEDCEEIADEVADDDVTKVVDDIADVTKLADDDKDSDDDNDEVAGTDCEAKEATDDSSDCDISDAPDDGIDEFCASYYNDKSHVPFIFKTFNAVRKFISSLRSTNK